MRQLFERVMAVAALAAIVWVAMAAQMAREASVGPTVALVKPFGAAPAALPQRSRS